MRKLILILMSIVTTVVLAGAVGYGWATGKTADWWSAWGQWIGGAGSILAALAALWIAREGWRRAEDRETRYERQREAEAEAARESQRRAALDETRRVALMALSIGTAGQGSAEVIATVINAMVYHLEVLSPAQARDLLGQFQSGGDQQGAIQKLIDDLSRKRNDQPLFGS